jgi:hypothetical protein
MMQWNFSWVESHDTAGAEQGTIGVYTLEVVEPEIWIVVTGVIFDEGKLSPPHGPVEPGCVNDRCLCRMPK